MKFVQEKVERLLVMEGEDGAASSDVSEVNGPKVELWWQIIVMVSNVLAYGTTLVVSFTSDYYMPVTQPEIVQIWDTQIAPAGWAFSIWGVIYMLLGLFVIYQALPSEWVPQRNDDMIYYQMNLMFALNMLGLAAWLPFFQSNTLWGLIVGWFILLFVTATDAAMMIISERNQVWWLEVFLVRLPFSLLTGWVTTATVLNTVFMLKSWGMADPPTEEKPLNPMAWTWADVLMVISEESWTIVALWLAEIVFEVVSYTERNPVYGGVYIWALAAILYENITKKDYNQNLIINASVIIGVHSISMIILTSYLVFEELQPWYEPLSFWNNGIVSLTDWSQLFNELNFISSSISQFFTDSYATRIDSV